VGLGLGEAERSRLQILGVVPKPVIGVTTMLFFILGTVIGTLGTWLVAHVYYTVSRHDQTLLYEKLNANARQWILEDQQEHLSVADLNELLRKKTIDPHSDYSLPYKVCLDCGSANIHRDTDVEVDGDVDDERGPVFSPMDYDALQCDDCGWRISERDHTWSDSNGRSRRSC
jgi:hypothetical protein